MKKTAIYVFTVIVALVMGFSPASAQAAKEKTAGQETSPRHG